MAKLFISLILFTSLATAASSAQDLKGLLSLRPGDKIKSLKSSGSVEGADFQIESQKGVIQSVLVDFQKAVASEKYLKANAKGFCLIQKPEGHIPLNRVFFITSDLKTRYELTPKGEIKSILIQDMPKAGANRPCLFSEALKKESADGKVKKVE